MPITRKVREEAPESEGENGERRFTSFMHKARWFAISQTIGDEFTPPRLPEWEAERALAALDIEQIAFSLVPMNAVVRDALLEAMRDRSPAGLVFDADHNGVNEYSLKWGFEEACKRAEIVYGETKPGGVIWHDLRRTFATRLRAN